MAKVLKSRTELDVNLRQLKDNFHTTFNGTLDPKDLTVQLDDILSQRKDLYLKGYFATWQTEDIVGLKKYVQESTPLPKTLDGNQQTVRPGTPAPISPSVLKPKKANK